MNKELSFDFKEINCPACDSDKPKLSGWRGGEAHQSGLGVKTAIVRCSNCSHQYPNPMPFPKDELEEVYVDAEDYFHGHDFEGKKQNGLNLMKDFEKRLGRKGRILDIGCGVGELLWAANESGWEYKGIDPSAEFIEVGRKKLGIEAEVAILDDVTFPSKHFDIIVMGGVIEHLYTPFDTLCEIHRILKDDGWLFFDSPNEDGLYMKFGNLYMKLKGRDWVVNLAPTFPPYHVQGFNPKSLETLVDRANFKVKELEIVGEITPQMGEQSIVKKIEFNVAKLVNFAGKLTNQGTYMGIYAQKK